MKNENTEYAIIVDTDSYSGNFERELCAYMTGQYGDCLAGRDIAEQATKELGKNANWFNENVIHNSDEHGCSRPVKIHPTPGFFNDGAGNHHKDGTNSDKVLKEYTKAVEQYEKQTKSKLPNKKPGCFPAYQSIIIYFDKKPTDNIRKILEQRANNFCNNPDKLGSSYLKSKKIKILAIRFAAITTTITESPIRSTMSRLETTFRRAKTNFSIFNGGNDRDASKHFSITRNGKRGFYTISVRQRVSIPENEHIGFTRTDIEKEIRIIQWDTASRRNGIQADIPEMRNLDLSELEMITNFSDNDIAEATAHRRQATAHYCEMFCLPSNI